MGAPNNESTSMLAQTYQFILNLVPGIVSMWVASQVMKYIFRFFSTRQEQKLKNLIDLYTDPKIEKLEAKIDLLIKMQKDDHK